MRAVELVFAVVWAAFWLYWLVAAFSMKRGRVPWGRELGIRVVIVVIVILLIRVGVFRDHGLNTELWRAGLGLVLFALGLGFDQDACGVRLLKDPTNRATMILLNGGAHEGGRGSGATPQPGA